MVAGRDEDDLGNDGGIPHFHHDKIELNSVDPASLSPEDINAAISDDLEVDDAGLTLPLSDETKPEVVHRTITPDDLEALADVEDRLNSRWPETKIDPTLDRMDQVLDLLGDPQHAYPSIHVAGTNGKTSVTRMIESLLRAFHRQTGRTTSPHLQSVTERIVIDGEPIHPADFVQTWKSIKPFVEMVDRRSEDNGGPRMSTFEVLTTMAFTAFADAPVAVAVVEVGMGGRWDATNVVHGDVTVITPVGMDHSEYLGDTIEEIAGEKAGIIKSRWDKDDLLTPPDNVAIIAEQDPAAMNVILEQAVSVDASVARAGSEYGVVERSVAVGGQTLTIRGLGGTYENIFLPLSGAYQARNAATALAAVEAFFGAGGGRQLDINIVREGFGNVSSPARLERIRTLPSVFVDATHNPQGARALAETLHDDFSFRRLIGIVSIFQDKDVVGVLETVRDTFDEIVVTEVDSPRAMPVDELAELARTLFGDERVHVSATMADAIEDAVALAEEEGEEEGYGLAGTGVVITGSVYSAGRARALLGKEPE